ncbi:MAG: type VI secretion system baseplate subunit TssE [Alphaproteobacteria bacterium]|nr:type VI secretion system baseplate subunit TssE [Alphaproteobacteria bacterium]
MKYIIPMAYAQEKTNQLYTVKEPSNVLGARPLLFDRLMDHDATQFFDEGSHYYLNRMQVEESIQLEISRLLNTRRAEGYTGEKKELIRGHKNNMSLPWLYGLPDFQSYDASNQSDWPKIATLIKDAIDYFEPRIKKAMVEIVRFDTNQQKLETIISGEHLLFQEKGEITFHVAIDCGTP